MRIAGTLASLAGLELAIEDGSQEQQELSIRRMMLLQSITLSIGGIPLIYLGEEWGILNDYDFVKDPAKAGDTRWVHRPKMRWEFLDDLGDEIGSHAGAVRKSIFRSLQQMIQVRKSLPALAGQKMDLVVSNNSHVLCFCVSMMAIAWSWLQTSPSSSKRSAVIRCVPPDWDASSRCDYCRDLRDKRRPCFRTLSISLARACVT